MASGLSDSSSTGAGAGEEERGVATEIGFGAGGDAAPFMDEVDVDIGFVVGVYVSESCGLGGGTGVSSTVECLPVVQGGISRNSSKVRTRGLQHFQPVQEYFVSVCE